MQLPAAAPLIFPSLDALSAADQAKHGKTSFLADYFDRRAQAKFTAQHPTSALNVLPQAQFASRYSDPTSAANTGGIKELVTGGKLGGSRKEQSCGGQDTQAGQAPAQSEGRGPISMLKKVVRENVLYLMVVNLPSAEETAGVNDILDDGVSGR